MEMLKKETRKETDDNENLISVYIRIEDSIETNTKQVETNSDKLDHLQSELVKTAKFNEQEQREYDSVNSVRMEQRSIRGHPLSVTLWRTWINRVASRRDDPVVAVTVTVALAVSFQFQEWQYSLHEEGEMDAEFRKFLDQQNQLENSIYKKLEEKISHDKAARYLNKLLSDSKDTMQEQELLLAKTENSYGSKLLESEQLNSLVSHDRTGLEELVQTNIAKEQEIDEIQKEIKQHETAIERKRVKFTAMNKVIDEVIGIGIVVAR